MKCGEGDCADWYTFEIDKRMPVLFQLGPDAGGVWPVEVEFVLYDKDGALLVKEASQGPALTVRSDLAPGQYFVAVGSATGGDVVPYSLLANREAPKKATGTTGASGGKKGASGAKVETKRGRVLEVTEEGRAVLLDLGKSQGVRVGLKGRLLRQGAAPTALEVVEVFPEGSLARVSGGGKAEAGSTTAEIDVPVAAPASGR